MKERWAQQPPNILHGLSFHCLSFVLLNKEYIIIIMRLICIMEHSLCILLVITVVAFRSSNMPVIRCNRAGMRAFHVLVRPSRDRLSPRRAKH